MDDEINSDASDSSSDSDSKRGHKKKKHKHRKEKDSIFKGIKMGDKKSSKNNSSKKHGKKKSRDDSSDEDKLPPRHSKHSKSSGIHKGSPSKIKQRPRGRSRSHSIKQLRIMQTKRSQQVNNQKTAKPLIDVESDDDSPSDSTSDEDRKQAENVIHLMRTYSL